jgi:hypothetical protein
MHPKKAIPLLFLYLAALLYVSHQKKCLPHNIPMLIHNQSVGVCRDFGKDSIRCEVVYWGFPLSNKTYFRDGLTKQQYLDWLECSGKRINQHDSLLLFPK